VLAYKKDSEQRSGDRRCEQEGPGAAKVLRVLVQSTARSKYVFRSAARVNLEAGIGAVQHGSGIENRPACIGSRGACEPLSHVCRRTIPVSAGRSLLRRQWLRSCC
jgi:hypothetical protein